MHLSVRVWAAGLRSAGRKATHLYLHGPQLDQQTPRELPNNTNGRAVQPFVVDACAQLHTATSCTWQAAKQSIVEDSSGTSKQRTGH